MHAGSKVGFVRRGAEGTLPLMIRRSQVCEVVNYLVTCFFSHQETRTYLLTMYLVTCFDLAIKILALTCSQCTRCRCASSSASTSLPYYGNFYHLANATTATTATTTTTTTTTRTMADAAAQAALPPLVRQRRPQRQRDGSHSKYSKCTFGYRSKWTLSDTAPRLVN